MKTLMQLCIVFVLGIAFGQAFFLDDDSKAERAWYACQDAHQLTSVPDYEYVCYNEKKLRKCFKKIVAVHQTDKDRIKDLIDYSVDRVKECPGFGHTDICRDSVSTKCKKSFKRKQLKNDDSICQELQGVRDCLTSGLKDSCAQKVIQEEIAEVNKVDHDCRTGNFNGGPCSDARIHGCGMVMYLDASWSEKTNFTCDPKLHAYAKACLASMKIKCKTNHQQDYIKSEHDLLENNCSHKWI